MHKINLKVIRGGLYKPPEAINKFADDMLSGTFKAWRKTLNQVKAE